MQDSRQLSKSGGPEEGSKGALVGEERLRKCEQESLQCVGNDMGRRPCFPQTTSHRSGKQPVAMHYP